MKTDGYDVSLLSSGALMKRGYSLLIENAGKAIAVITAIVVILVTFTEIGFYELGSRNLTGNMLMLLIASYVIYFSLEDAGERLAKGEKPYKDAISEYEGVCIDITGQDIPRLRQFVEDYCREELRFRRESYLARKGLSISDYEEWQRERRKEKNSRIYKRAEGMRQIKLSVNSLLHVSAEGARELRDPKGQKLIKLLTGLIPSTVCTLFTVSVMLGARTDLTREAVIESLLKLSSLPVIALKGYTSGYEYIIGSEIPWLKSKTRLLRAFTGKERECKQ